MESLMTSSPSASPGQGFTRHTPRLSRLAASDDDIRRCTEAYLRTVRRWNKATEREVIRLVVERLLETIRANLAAFGKDVQAGVVDVGTAGTEVERLHRDLGPGGELRERISDLAVYWSEALRQEYLSRGGKMATSFWISRWVLPYARSWLRKYILHDQSIGDVRGPLSLWGSWRR